MQFYFSGVVGGGGAGLVISDRVRFQHGNLAKLQWKELQTVLIFHGFQNQSDCFTYKEMGGAREVAARSKLKNRGGKPGRRSCSSYK